MKKPFVICFLISIVAVVVVFFLWLIGVLHPWELKFYDIKFNVRGPRQPLDDIVIVSIDEESLKEFGRWPWPRSILAKGIRNLKDAGVKAIGVDVIFPEPSQNTYHDKNYANALKYAGNVVGALYFEYETKDIVKDGNIVKEYTTKLVLPISLFEKAYKILGFTNASPDDDGVLRIAELSKVFNGKTYYSFNSQIASLKLGKKVDEIIPAYTNMIYANFKGPDRTYKRFSFSLVYKKLFPEKWLKDKVVLIGSTATGAFDHYPTPFDKMFPGVEFHATVIDNLINGDYIFPFSDYFIFLITLILCIVLGQVFLKIKPLIATVIFLLFTGILFYTSQYLFNIKNWHFDFFKPALSVIFCFSGVMAYRFTTEAREKRWIKKTFSTYLSPQVVNELSSSPDKLKLGGERKEITVLFSDIRGFTTISEQLEPEAVSSLLNEYLSAMTEIVFKHDGTLDKFIGDAIMVIWGAPVVQEDHPKRAVMCAIDMLEKLKELKEGWQKQGKILIDIGIGINTGVAIVGNMGSKQRMEYTAIGDNVNLASRLEGLNKQYGTRIIISDSTYERVKDIVECRYLGEVRVKGKEKPTTIYEVVKRI